MVGLAAVAGLLLWMVYNWRGGTLLVQEVRRCMASERIGQAALLLVAVSANLLNAAYEIVGAFVVAPNWALPVPAVARWTGMGLFAAGLAWVIACRRTLGRNWSVVAGSRAGVLHTQGPYAVVRHPIYAGAIVLYAGLLLAQANAGGAAVYGIHILGFVVKAHVEDRILRVDRRLPYTEYSRSVRWKLFPGLW